MKYVEYIARIRMPVNRITLLGFIPVEVLLLWRYHVASEPLKSTIVFLATIVGAAFALYSHMGAVEEKRTAAADKLIERWGSQQLEASKDLLLEIFDNKNSLKAVDLARTRERGQAIKYPDADHMAKRRKLVAILGFCEEVALSVRMGTADEEKIRRFLESVMTRAWDTTEDWVKKEREVDKADDPDAENNYIELQKLVEHWKKARRPK